MWFEALTGFKEETPEQVRQNLHLDGAMITSRVNGRQFQCGHLTTPRLADLRREAREFFKETGQLQVREVIGDVQYFHGLPEHAGAFFQAASQFNLLEMISPEVTPEMGIGRYSYDKTQGPACAIACGAGTIYRNYFVELGEQIGQLSGRQVDCLEDIGRHFDNERHQHWVMQNGYALATEKGLATIGQHLEQCSAAEYDAIKSLLRIGIQWDTEVTITEQKQLVTQAYCSAMPVAYSPLSAAVWEAFARLVLEASYEATLYAALLNRQATGNKQVFLTLLGGGAFGNKSIWIADAIQQALQLFAKQDLELIFVSYGSSSPLVQSICADWK